MTWIVIILMIPVGATVRGYVASILWGWFIAATFGLPEISTLQAYGIALVCAVFFESFKRTNKEPGEIAYCAFMSSVALPLVCLLFGWIVKGIM